MEDDKQTMDYGKSDSTKFNKDMAKKKEKLEKECIKLKEIRKKERDIE